MRLRVLAARIAPEVLLKSRPLKTEGAGKTGNYGDSGITVTLHQTLDGSASPSQLRRLARKRNLAGRPRQNNATGKSPKNLSSPRRKNIPLNTSGKSVV
jgi:hypothetical protein